MRAAILDDNNVVINIIEASEKFLNRFHPGKWVDVTNTWVTIGSVYDPVTGTFTTPEGQQIQANRAPPGT